MNGYYPGQHHIQCAFEEKINTKYNSPLSIQCGIAPAREHMMSDWTFLSNYGHVLVCLAKDSEVRLRDVALEVGITERAVQKIVKDMQDAGFLTVSKQGRCNRYRINNRKSLRHGLESHCNVGKLLALVAKAPKQSSAKDSKAAEQPILAAPITTAPLPEEIVTRYPSQAQKVAGEAGKKPDGKKTAKKSDPADTREQGSLF
jgi:hypothetical protein